jgi:hypothetical protein
MLREIPIAKSSHLSQAVYDDETMELTVRFVKSNAVYTYYAVPGDLITDLSNAISSGQNFYQFIQQGAFEYKRIA